MLRAGTDPVRVPRAPVYHPEIFIKENDPPGTNPP